MKDILKLALALAVFAGLACSGLAVVYQWTKPVIDGLAAEAFSAQLKSLFPDGTVDEREDRIALEPDNPTLKFESAYRVMQNGVPIGVAVKVSGPSYAPGTVVLVGVGLDRRIVGVRILSNNDTPGLGANAKDESYVVNPAKGLSFAGQFKDKAITDAFEVKKDVDCITASTITSRAITEMVKDAARKAAAWLESLMEGGLE